MFAEALKNVWRITLLTVFKSGEIKFVGGRVGYGDFFYFLPYTCHTVQSFMTNKQKTMTK